MTLVEHHIKYKEIHGEDKTIWMEAGDHRRLHNQLRKNGKCTIPAEILNKITTTSRLRQKKRWNKQYYSLIGKIKLLLNGCVYQLQCICYYFYLKTYIPIPSEELQTYSEDEYILPKEEYLFSDKDPIELNDKTTYIKATNPKETYDVIKDILIDAQTTRDKIFQLIEANPTITNIELATALNLSVRSIERGLKRLKHEGRLNRKREIMDSTADKIIGLVRNHPGISNEEMATMINVHVRTIERNVKRLKEENRWP